MPHAFAKINGKTVAETDTWETVEGNIYFPPAYVDDVKAGTQKLKTADVVRWNTSYYNINVDGNEVKDAAWYYPEPKDKAKNIKDYVAFYKSKVQVTAD